jgi:Zn-dependent protease with chaperone function
MMLAPLLRTLCFALVSAALLQLALEALVWRFTPRSPESASGHSSRNARRTERLLLVATLAARILPWLLAFGALVPAYLHGEDNTAAEHVALPCIAAAALVVLWIATTLFRAATTSLRTQRYCGRCQPAERTIGGHQVHLHRGSRSLLAVAGIFRSRLLVSEQLLEEARVPPSALEVALTHEAAHATHRDNLKLLVLALLPSIPFATAARPSLDTRWRLAAELAADHDSTAGDAHRSLLLADLLVLLARDHSGPTPAGMVTLLSAPDHLRVRVETLLRATAPHSPSAQQSLDLRLPLAALSAALVALGVACVLFGHRAAELLLHLG